MDDTTLPDQLADAATGNPVRGIGLDAAGRLYGAVAAEDASEETVTLSISGRRYLVDAAAEIRALRLDDIERRLDEAQDRLTSRDRRFLENLRAGG